ncbi:hypothetical protein HHL11_10620 [Ramlibacter sp. G-1-2-2]|uniref:Uncharacterized protein n=1 Tax=Ramlibacter agri TaxID=2728837 RepID=A0A848H0V5_9BURK|nr:hypothetical protein [Ramlibacter agri]NML44204.1 hypothetical protein [Ramlibacter agri]
MAPAALPAGADLHTPDGATLEVVRPKVRALLEQSPGFAALPAAQQKDIAQTMVRVATYMANPQCLAREEFADPQLHKEMAQAMAGGVDGAKDKASDKLGTFAGADFKAGALQQGTQEFKNLVGAVDFPAFVGGLIQNVFQAIVTASIQQMEAYGKLLKAVAQTVDQFAQDNITMNNARDWLTERYPEDLTIATGGEDDDNAGPHLAVQGEDQDAALRRINQEQQLLKPITDLSDPEQETRLVTAARLQMARMRQQMLSSMVLLGINRIVVTDGLINAKVMFDFRASDEAKRRARASLYDRDQSSNKNVSAGGFALPWGAAGSVNVNEQQHMTTVQSSVDESSESKAELKAKLTGEVRVNFKSDYFPMEKLASPGMIASIQGNATPFDPNPPRPAAAPGSAPAVPAPTAASVPARV